MKPTTAYLIEVQDKTGKVVKRRISLNPISAMDFIESFAENQNGTVDEREHQYWGYIQCSDTYYYWTISNVAVV